ncbi:hypothetical protein HYH03_016186 [Edaphochlamys debaryana]|uniref:Uncharacterized protein n=1 Tax=Edaphochlamys debaryana TaxID=47281 RepID=A0A835XS87_9CHLO|nr:hypothetical protein HYH03_016186 [Edaphochlamys debaryana]|eukprot:KAG2485089.1 hypothetical protein HYH03_016186 [Edaphochlamys debaryana]
MASALYGVTAGGAPCDGLIFGETTTTTTQHLRDNDDPVSVTDCFASVSSTLWCAAPGSFYDQAGELAESKLEALSRSQPGSLLGWMAYRPAAPGSGPPRPSMREAAVTAALLRRQWARHGGAQAVLLLLAQSSGDHGGATLTWQFRCFQARPSPSGDMLLDPVELRTGNLGGHTGVRAYSELGSAAGLAATLATTGLGSAGSGPAAAAGAPGGAASSAALGASSRPSSMGSAAGAAAAAGRPPSAAALGLAAAAGFPGADSAALAALAAGAKSQVDGVRAYCEGLLGALQGLCGQAAAGEVEVAELRRRRDAALAQLALRQ